jgi:acetolactate synthase-1/2/3 large subunit
VLAEEKLPVKIALFNNSYLGMVRQWQQLFYDRRYSGVKMWNPDFVKLGEAYSIPTIRVSQVDGVRAAFEWARAIEGPAMIEFVVDAEENVFPMVPPGASLQETIESADDVAPKMQQVAVAAGSDKGGV